VRIGYLLREGVSGFRRAKLAMFSAIVTIAISLLILSLFSILLINANSVVESLRERVEMEAFLQEGLGQGELDSLAQQIRAVAGVRDVAFISKDSAAAIYREEFGQDIYKVLDFNPLPASFKIYLQQNSRTAKAAQTIYDQVVTFKGVDEVIYRKTLLELLDKRATILLWIALGIGVFITISSVFLVANTIRLAIYNKRKIIQTMKLLGATRSFVRIPFLLEGVIQGLIGGVLASCTVFLVFEFLARYVSAELIEFVRVEIIAYGIIVGVGCLLGLVGSMISVRRFIGEGVSAA
jgi:cell division transport system permease protein